MQTDKEEIIKELLFEYSTLIEHFVVYLNGNITKDELIMNKLIEPRLKEIETEIEKARNENR